MANPMPTARANRSLPIVASAAICVSRNDASIPAGHVIGRAAPVEAHLALAVALRQIDALAGDEAKPKREQWSEAERAAVCALGTS
jgi:hypothetical protein